MVPIYVSLYDKFQHFQPGQLITYTGMPTTQAMLSKPELGKNGLWMEMAAKIITGVEPVDSFDKFVEDWKKRGGDQFLRRNNEKSIIQKAATLSGSGAFVPVQSSCYCSWASRASNLAISCCT